MRIPYTITSLLNRLSVCVCVCVCLLTLQHFHVLTNKLQYILTSSFLTAHDAFPLCVLVCCFALLWFHAFGFNCRKSLLCLTFQHFFSLYLSNIFLSFQMFLYLFMYSSVTRFGITSTASADCRRGLPYFSYIAILRYLICKVCGISV